VEYCQSDLKSAADADSVMKDMDYAFLLAASTSGAASISSTPMIHVTPNVVINTNCLEACYKNRIKKALWLSSTTSYPEMDHPVVEDEMFLDDPYEKYYFVGWMKRFTEVLCNMYSNKLKEKMPVVVLRPTNIYGPYDKFDPDRSHVLPALIRKVAERQSPIEVWGDGYDERDFIYVDDMVDSVVLAMEKINTYDPINIGSGKWNTVREILNIVLQIDGYTNAEVVFNPDRPTMIPKRRVSIKKAKNLLGFEPKVNIEDGIMRTIEFYKGELANSGKEKL
jgi:GDP-L-fucose synthase